MYLNIYLNIVIQLNIISKAPAATRIPNTSVSNNLVFAENKERGRERD